MAAKQKRYLAEVYEMIFRHAERYPYEVGDFQDGYLTDEASSRVLSAIEETVPEEVHRFLRKLSEEEQFNATIDELVAIGAMERVPDKTGKPTYRIVREFSQEEFDRAWARADAQIETEAAEHFSAYMEARKRRKVQ